MHLSDACARAFCRVACEEASLEALLAASDVVSLHVALTDATLHLVNDQSARHFRKGEGRGGVGGRSEGSRAHESVRELSGGVERSSN